MLRRNVHRVTSYMQRSNIAHNLLFSRGEAIGKNSGDSMTTLRIYIWPRISVTGTDCGLQHKSVVIPQIDVDGNKRQPVDVHAVLKITIPYRGVQIC